LLDVGARRVLDAQLAAVHPAQVVERAAQRIGRGEHQHGAVVREGARTEAMVEEEVARQPFGEREGGGVGAGRHGGLQGNGWAMRGTIVMSLPRRRLRASTGLARGPCDVSICALRRLMRR
jgi:hypothetical protein